MKEKNTQRKKDRRKEGETVGMFVEASACLLVTCSSRLFRHAFKPRASRWRCDMRHRQRKNVGKWRERDSVCSLRKQIGKAMHRHTITQQTRTLAIHSGKNEKKKKVIDNYIYIVYIYRPVSLSLTVSYVLYVHHRQCECFQDKKKKKKQRRPSFHHSSTRTTRQARSSLRRLLSLILFLSHARTHVTCTTHLCTYTRTLFRFRRFYVHKRNKRKFNDSIKTRNTTPCSNRGK